MLSDYTPKQTLTVPILCHCQINTIVRHPDNIPKLHTKIDFQCHHTTTLSHWKQSETLSTVSSDYTLKQTFSVPTLHHFHIGTRMKSSHYFLQFHTKMESHYQHTTSLSHKYQRHTVSQCPQIPQQNRLSLLPQCITPILQSDTFTLAPDYTPKQTLTVPALDHSHIGTRGRHSNKVPR